MKTSIKIGLMGFLYWIQPALAENNLTLPWSEFKTLYTQQLEQQLKKEETITPTLYSFDQASYQVKIEKNQLLVSAEIKGRRLQGNASSVQLFGRGIALTQIETSEGATLMSDESGYQLYLSDKVDSFVLKIQFLSPLQTQNNQSVVSLQIPPAVSNQLSLLPSDDFDLHPNKALTQLGGQYYFSPTSHLSLQFDPSHLNQLPPSIDILTEISLKGEQLIFNLFGMVRKNTNPSFILQFDPRFQYLQSTVNRTDLKQIDQHQIQIERLNQPYFNFTFAIKAAALTKQIQLPHIVNNQGLEQNYQVIHPIEAEIYIQTSQGMPLKLSPSSLPDSLLSHLSHQENYRLRENQQLSIQVQRFETVETTKMVLDDIYFYHDYDKNGRQISGLKMVLPEQAGERLWLDAVKGADIWKVRVNGQATKVYHAKGRWMIPLGTEKPASVEISWLQKQAKMQLKGDLPLFIPKTGIAARHVLINIGLPEDIQLLAVDGEINPTQNSTIPDEIKQNEQSISHLFETHFYRGGEITATIYYKEPIGE